MQRRSLLLLAVLFSLSVGAGGAAYALRHYELVLRVPRDVPVKMRGAIPLQAQLRQTVDVRVEAPLSAKVQLPELEVPIDERIAVPVDMVLQVPIDTEVTVEPIELSLEVPIDTVLTERELDLRGLEIPLDSDVLVDDVLPIALTVPIDTHVETALGMVVPVKAQVPVRTHLPIHQKVHVKDTIKLDVHALRIPLHATIPVRTQIQLREPLHVHGEVSVPVHAHVVVPLKKTIRARLDGEVPVRASLEGSLPATLDATLDAKAVIDGAVQTQLGAIRIDAEDVQVAPKAASAASR